MIIKQAKANNGRLEGPAGRGFALRPLDASAAFPVWVKPEGYPALPIADTGAIMLDKRFNSLQVRGMNGPNEADLIGTWELTVLESEHEWRTSQRVDRDVGGPEVIFDKVVTFNYTGTNSVYIDNDFSLIEAPDGSGVGNIVKGSFDVRAYKHVLFSIAPNAAGQPANLCAGLMARAGSAPGDPIIADATGAAWVTNRNPPGVGASSAEIGPGIPSANVGTTASATTGCVPVRASYVTPRFKNTGAAGGAVTSARILMIGWP